MQFARKQPHKVRKIWDDWRLRFAWLPVCVQEFPSVLPGEAGYKVYAWMETYWWRIVITDECFRGYAEHAPAWSSLSSRLPSETESHWHG